MHAWKEKTLEKGTTCDIGGIVCVFCQNLIISQNALCIMGGHGYTYLLATGDLQKHAIKRRLMR